MVTGKNGEGSNLVNTMVEGFIFKNRSLHTGLTDSSVSIESHNKIVLTKKFKIH